MQKRWGVRSGRRSTGSGGARAGRLFGCGGGAAGSVCLTLLDAPGLSASPPRPFLTFPGSPTPRDPGPSPTPPTRGPRPSPTLPAPGSPALPGPPRALAAGGVRKNPSDPLRILCRIEKTSLKMSKQQPTQFINPETPGYVGFANLPNQVHRKSVKKGFEFTLMVVGESGLGKSTLINSLFLTDLYPERIIPGAAEKIERTVQIEASTVEIEERGVKLRLTVVDTPGYGDAINCRDCFKTIIAYIDEQFERYLHDESGLNRRHIVDNRVHCCFYFISPFGHGLKPLDVAFMKAIHNKVNIVPVIAKADTLTLKERERLKKRILDEIEEHNIKIYHLPDAESDEDEDFKEQTRLLKASIPFSVVGSNQLIEAKGKKVRGRLYPWGVVEVENPEHNDFLKLRTMLITHMQDLQEVTQDLHYENFRSERLKRGGRKVDNEDMNKDQILLEKEAELRRMQEMIARMQAQMQMQLQGGDGDGGAHGHHV
ncbi:septin-2 isoform X1 [Prionailurus bengalensis]|nr:septin-2 isoform X1 [Prionailurus bengalensis]